MPPILLQQALFLRRNRETPQLVARSAGFDEGWRAEAEALIHDFGERPTASFRCPLTVFARPLTDKHIAVVRVRDEGDAFPTGLRFHYLVVEQKAYETWIRDPFMLAEKVAPTWEATELPALTIAHEAFSPRTLAQVQAVLKRIKGAALKEGEDPEAPDFQRTMENSESPALLGGAQILVDGGRLIFERPEGDLTMVAGLWLLLPEATRCQLWPTSFAFSQGIDFDVFVVPHIDGETLEGYTTEEQAADYPAGAYELALQRAAENGDQRDLDAVFQKRNARQTIKLALMILVLVSIVALASRWLDLPGSNPTPNHQKAAAAVGAIGVGDPWLAAGMIVYGNELWKKR